MKSTLKKSLKRVIALTAVAGAIVLSSFTTSFANDNSRKPFDNAYSIEYAGTNNDGLVFNLKFENPTASKFNVVLKNEDGETLFQKEYKDKNFAENIVLAKEEGDARITFTIATGSEKYSEQFTVKTTAKMVEDVVVKKN